MSNPYTTLGVPKYADSETIKRAHRKAAKRTHPDAGGSKEEFQAVNSAYMVLRDPLRRRRYDETGDESELRDGTVSELVRLFVQVAAGCPDHANPINLTRQNIEQQLATLKRNQRQATSDAKGLRAKAARVKHNGDGLNLLATALENQAAAVERQVAAMGDTQDRGRKMLELLAGYDFDMPEQNCEFTFGGMTMKGRVTAWPTIKMT